MTDTKLKPKGTVLFVVQELDGYTDGRPSWRKVGSARYRDDAEAKLAFLQEYSPKAKLRIRQVRRSS